jgi:hypothetical protein
VINEPMVEDGYRWYGIQGKLIAAIRAAAPNHTIIASGHRWSGLSEMLFLEPYADANIIYNFHFYEPFAFTHQGATWAGPNLPFYKNVPYPSSPQAVQALLNTIEDEPARYNLLRYGEDNWNAARIDRELGRLRGPLNGVFTLRVMSLGLFENLRVGWIESCGFMICVWRSKRMGSVGPCGTMRVGLRR